MKTRGPAAKDGSAFDILHDKIEKWLEAGGSVTNRELVRFLELSFGNPYMRGADFYNLPDHRRLYANDCDVAVRLIDSAIESLKITESESLSSATARPSSKRIFIGHGHSPAWKDIKDFLVNRLGLEYEEFNREPPAGKSTKERLQEMLGSGFALIVMTGEDEAKDGKV